MGDGAAQNPKKKKLLAKTKIQNFKFEAPHTKSFNINWNFLPKTYFWTSLQTFYNIGYVV